jgi:hypothetical protein
LLVLEARSHLCHLGQLDVCRMLLEDFLQSGDDRLMALDPNLDTGVAR